MTETRSFSEPFQVGATLKRAFFTFLANFVSFNLLGLLISIPGLLLIVLVFFALGIGIFSLLPADGTAETELPDFGFIHFLGVLGIIALGFSIQYLLAAVIVHGTLQHLRGNKPRILDSLLAGLRRFVPVVLVSFVLGILFVVGWMLFVIPGIIFALMFCVAVPVVMVEQRGVFASLSRSRELTRGQRWRILGLFLLAIALTSIALFVVMIPIEVLTFMLPELLIVRVLVQLAMQFFMIVFLAVLLGVIYHDLRVAKEGISTAQIAAVFD